MKALNIIKAMRSYAGLGSLLATRGGGPVLHQCELLRASLQSGLPHVALADLLVQVRGAPLGPDERVVMNPDLRGGGSGSVAELGAICALCLARRPRTILEFGTCDGYSTWHLLANAAPDATITTLDLPAGVKVEGSTDPELQGAKPRHYLPRDPRVRLVEMDSRLWTPDLASPVDLCFIDAGHSYDCVRNDTEKALSLCAKGSLLLWHDATWRRSGYGVNRYLKELLAKGLAVRLVQVGPFDYSGLAACTV